ncbi:MAG: tetratricopeptide repeat protein [Spirochaeta sp.]|nr:tetratricopeptide repeat protein [Spirochaeta sp.]
MKPRSGQRSAWVTVGVIVVLAMGSASCASRVSYRELAQEYYNLGNAFFELGDYERSFEYYSRAVELDEELPATGYNLARLHTRRGEYDVALNVLDELLTSDPDSGLFRETRAFVLYRADRPTDARREYRALISAYPARVRLRYNLALLEIREDRPELALRILEEGVELAAEDEQYHWLFAEAAYLAGEQERAAVHLETYRELVGDDTEALARLARRYAAWDYTLAALEVLAQIPETVESDTALVFLQASLYLTGTPEFDRGIGLLRSALQKGFTEPEPLRDLIEGVRPGDRDVVEELIGEFDIDISGEADEEQDAPQVTTGGGDSLVSPPASADGESDTDGEVTD